MNENTTSPQSVPEPPQNESASEAQKAIQFQITYDLIDRAEKYIKESKNEMIEAEGESEWSEEKIDEVLQDMSKLKTEIRDMEVEHIDETIEWTLPETGQQEEVLLRDVDPVRFDKVDSEYNRLMSEFKKYSSEHAEKLYKGEIPLE